jgi:hypothetical protein
MPPAEGQQPRDDRLLDPAVAANPSAVGQIGAVRKRFARALKSTGRRLSGSTRLKSQNSVPW